MNEKINYFIKHYSGTTKEDLAKENRIPINEIGDFIKGLENCGILFAPTENEIRLKKEIFSEQELKDGEEFLHYFTNLLYPPTKLSEINSSHIEKNISINCQITGEQSQKAIKKLGKFRCNSCGTELSVFNPLDSINSLINPLNAPYRCICGGKNFEELDYSEYTDFSIIFVRDLLNTDDLTAIKKYESKKVYVVNETLPNVKKVKIYGKVLIEPKSQNISLICFDIEPLENEIQTFVLTEEKIRKFKDYFCSKEIQKEIHKQINPDIVGKVRGIAKKAIILQLHSPPRIPDIERKKIIRGGINIISYGDTKTAKSEINKDVTNKGTFPIGEYNTCETGGRTGLLYTIDSDNRALIWGSIPLNDLGLVVLDGMQNLTSLEMGEFREALEQQEIIVRRSVSGEALARVRINGLMNPNKPMNNYLYKCQGLEDNSVFAKTPDLTRFDFFIPYCKGDVSPTEISRRKSEIRIIPNDVFLNHIYWAWSRKPEQITYTNSAILKIQELSENLIVNYSMEKLPIVHNGAREILTRLSAAMACQMNSTDSTNEEVIVETVHIQKAFDFYVEILELLELPKYKADLEGKSELNEGEIVSITKELDGLDWKILSEIKTEPKSSSQLADMFEISTRTIKEHYSNLKNFGLIETKVGFGASLSVKGVKLVRWGLQNDSEMVKKNFTNEPNGEEKLHHFTNEIRGASEKQNLNSFTEAGKSDDY